MQYDQIKDPQWADAAHTAINCLVDFSDLVEDFVPFTASPADTTSYGPQIFAECVAGNYGTVAEYVAPKPYVPDAAVNKAMAQQRLKTTDWVNEPDVYDTSRNPHLLNRDEFLDYRSWCRNIAVNPVAGNLDWPTEPTASWSQA